jgi:hypothetical protein
MTIRWKMPFMRCKNQVMEDYKLMDGNSTVRNHF